MASAFLADDDGSPLVGVKVVPPRRKRLRGLHLDSSCAATGSRAAMRKRRQNGQPSSKGPICSLGLAYLRRLRGRSLSSAATQSRSASVWADRTLPLGASVFVKGLGWAS